ncbi:hypothetical protein SAMN05443377_1457 [Propionibacterium cyclohexanicum]|uniref:Uncharacterized protein n=1 Tax=Propionibacterium cyclohexanicum TaxID=64702 RepID=A0A1H9U7L3_9ACTN|nr:hypothetical protein [Propionibacterium cyclohexanicum]SES05339.1 hypothetical protein SAMN05443377_1457 [Propionibacterium cyclohexanicum]
MTGSPQDSSVALTEQKTIAEPLNVEISEQFHLFTQEAQLSFAVTTHGHLLTTYFGPKVGQQDLSWLFTDEGVGGV